MEVSSHSVSFVVTYLWDLQPTYIGVIIHLLSTTDIPVVLISLDHHEWSFTLDNATMYSTKLNPVHLPKCKPIFSLRKKLDIN